MGGAQPLAVTMNEGCALCVEVDLQRIERRIASGYLDERAGSLDDALARLDAARARAARSRSACSATPPRCCPELVARGVDGRRRHRPDERARPAQRLRPRRPHASSRPTRCAPRTRTTTSRRVGQSVLAHVGAIRDARPRAAPRPSTTATSCAASPPEHGDADAFAYPGFVPAYIRPLFCEGKGPFRWVALSGDPADIAATDHAILELFGDQAAHPPLDRAGPRARRTSRACPRASAGSATASATSPGCASTSSSPRARSRRRS